MSDPEPELGWLAALVASAGPGLTASDHPVHQIHFRVRVAALPGGLLADADHDLLVTVHNSPAGSVVAEPWALGVPEQWLLDGVEHNERP